MHACGKKDRIWIFVHEIYIYVRSYYIWSFPHFSFISRLPLFIFPCLSSSDCCFNCCFNNIHMHQFFNSFWHTYCSQFQKMEVLFFYIIFLHLSPLFIPFNFGQSYYFLFYCFPIKLNLYLVLKLLVDWH